MAALTPFDVWSNPSLASNVAASALGKYVNLPASNQQFLDAINTLLSCTFAYDGTQARNLASNFQILKANVSISNPFGFYGSSSVWGVVLTYGVGPLLVVGWKIFNPPIELFGSGQTISFDVPIISQEYSTT